MVLAFKLTIESIVREFTGIKLEFDFLNNNGLIPFSLGFFTGFR